MNLKRAVGFGTLLWVFVFVIFSIIMFIPSLVDRHLAQHVVFWIILAPFMLALSKWYFKHDPPTLKKGLGLGVIAVIIGVILDLAITIPLFTKGEQSLVVALGQFYGEWELYVGLLEIMVIATLAGGEFDKTFTRRNS